MDKPRAESGEAADRRVTIEALYEHLSDSLGLRWPEPAIGAAGTLGATQHEGWRVPTVGYLNFIHPPQVQIVGNPEIAYLDESSGELARHLRHQLTRGATRLVVVADGRRLPYTLHQALRDAEPCPMTHEPERSARFQGEMSLKAVWSLGSSEHDRATPYPKTPDH
ncbi:hypothetical protein [Salinisphaera sp.]|uniref:hypothetical protein n=1 Tax=Salinisphaera sp. TaxID=1914330 RepID=UPI002D774E2F|nr:hypothetical protein [Salinisphaera sp.]HET7315161.1 hypothetical protein [Salinisphaera sp.]